MPFKSEEQRRYLWANEPEIARDWTDTYGSRIQKNNGGIMEWADQGGLKNYLGEQPMVNAPQNWRSGPNSPPTELAYITDAEKDLILRSNIHGSLPNGPNEGPSGIMSLDGQGDYTPDRSPAGRQSSPGGPDRSRIAQDKHEDHMRSILTGQQNIGQTSAVSDRVRQGAVPEYAFGPDGQQKYIGSAYKSTGQPGFLSNMFSRTPGYRSIYNKQGWFGGPDIQFNKGAGQYQFNDPRTGNVKPGYGGRILGGLASMVTGIPFIGGAIGSAYDYGKGIFGRKPRDMSQYNNLGLFGLPKGTLDFDSDARIQDTSFSPVNVPASEYEGMFPFEAYEEFAPDDQDIRSIDTIANEYTPGNWKGSEEEEGWSWSDFLKTLPRM